MAKHGRIPEGSVVIIRSDWSKKWGDPTRFNEKPLSGVSLDALNFLHLKRKVLFHGHEPLREKRGHLSDKTPEVSAEALLAAHAPQPGPGAQ